MSTVTLPQLNERLKLLPPERFVIVYNFFSHLSKPEMKLQLREIPTEVCHSGRAFEDSLRHA
jgi:hypothetical protein